MSDKTSKIWRLSASLIVVAAVFVGDGCHCEDPVDGQWDFEEPWPDVGPDAIGEDDWDWAFPDPSLDPDPPDWEETRWDTEVLSDEIPRSFAYDDRTSVIVDRQGTVWVGYHRCSDSSCSNPDLVVGHRHYDTESWQWETIEPHTGLFGLQVIEAGQPIAVYLDGQSRQLKAATRQPDGQWRIEVLPVGDVAPFDGFDVSRDAARYFVSHASQERREIQFLTYNTAAEFPFWRRLQSMESARSAAYERGLRGGNQLNFFLVHRDHDDEFRLSEYDLGSDTWTRSTERFPAQISSFLVRQNGQLCTSSSVPGDLLITCGSFEDVLADTAHIHQGDVHYLSSMIESRDESLYVAYHDAATGELHIGRRPDGGQWSTESVHPGDTAGISTAIDHRDHLLTSFYHCEGNSCALTLLQRVVD